MGTGVHCDAFKGHKNRWYQENGKIKGKLCQNERKHTK